MKKVIIFFIATFLFSGCWVAVEPSPVHSVVVEYCEPGITYPRSDYPAYCEGECCVWQDEYYDLFCEEVWCLTEHKNYCGWELVQSACGEYYYY